MQKEEIALKALDRISRWKNSVGYVIEKSDGDPLISLLATMLESTLKEVEVLWDTLLREESGWKTH